MTALPDLDSFTVTAVVTGPAGDTFLWRQRVVCGEIANKVWEAFGKPDVFPVYGGGRVHGDLGLRVQADPLTIQHGDGAA